MIKKEGNKYSVWSEDGKKRLGKPASKEQAVKRLRQVEYFKHHPEKALQSEPTAVEDLRKTMQLLGLDYKKFMGVE
jgi:hypothetical protein